MSFGWRALEILERRLTNIKSQGEDKIRACCPFHEGPSTGRTFSVDLGTGYWQCYHATCGLFGTFPKLMKMLGMTSTQIDQLVAETRTDVAVPEHFKLKALLNRKPVFLPEYVLGAWSELPQSLLDAGFTEEILASHEVGVDKARNRIVFPIRDFLGRLAAVNGRAMEPWMQPRYQVYDAAKARAGREAGPFEGLVEKYIPSSREHLYGYYTVYPRRFFQSEAGKTPIIIVEGYKACLWLRQLGYSDTLAIQGSELSPAQYRLLSKLNGPFYIMHDKEPGKSFPDRQGRCASESIAARLSHCGRSFVCRYPAELPPKTQPDSLTAPQIEYMLQTARTTTQLVLERMS